MKERPPGLKSPTARRTWFLLALLAVVACDINSEPVAPSWETEFNIPLVCRVRTMEEMLGESGFILEGDSQVLAYAVDGGLTETIVGDELVIGDFSGGFADSLGEFEIRDPDPGSTQFTLGTLWPPAELLHGSFATIPPFAFVDLTAQIPDFETYSQLVLAAGTLRVTVTNNTPVPLTISELQLFDVDTGLPVVTLGYAAPVDPGETGWQEADLAGRVFSNRLGVRLGGGSSGSQGVVLVDAGASLLVSAELTGLRASSATAQLPPAEVRFQDSLELPDDMVVTRAVLARGTIAVTTVNEIPLGAWMVVSIPDLTDPSGDPVELRFHMEPAESTYHEVDLTLHRLTPPLPEGGDPQYLPLGVQATTEDTGDREVTVQAGDRVRVDAAVSGIELVEVEGVLSTTTIDVPPSEEEIDLPSGLEGVVLERATLDIFLMTSLDIPLRLDLVARGWDEDGREHVLPVRDTLEAGGSPGEDTLRVTLTEANSDLLGFVNSVPERIALGGSVILGNGVDTATVRADDYLRGEYRFSAPLVLRVEEQVIELDPSRTDVEPEGGNGEEGEEAETTVSGDFTNYLLEGALHTDLTNHLPLGMSILFKLGTDSAGVFDHPEVTLGPVSLAAALVDPQTGFVEFPVASRNEIAITNEDLDIFKNDGETTKHVYVGTELAMPGTNGEAVSLRGTDYVEITAFARVRILVDPEGWGDEN